MISYSHKSNAEALCRERNIELDTDSREVNIKLARAYMHRLRGNRCLGPPEREDTTNTPTGNELWLFIQLAAEIHRSAVAEIHVQPQPSLLLQRPHTEFVCLLHIP